MSGYGELNIASVLHELREPVHAIRGFLAIVLAGRAGPITETQCDFLSTANRAAARMERLIQDIHILSSGGTGGVPLVLERINLLNSVEACIAELQPMASELSVEFTIETRVPEGLEMLADPDRIDQVLLNLLENALRYGGTGERIVVSLRGGRSRVLCVVENVTRLEARQLALEDWSRSDTRPCDVREQPYRAGQGLGLGIITRLVHAHNGRVLVRVTPESTRVGFVMPRHGR